MPLSIRPKLKETLDKLERHSIISKSNSPTEWVNSIVIVEKKNGSLRLCLDSAELNAGIIRKHRQVPTIEEILSRLHGKKYFTVIDMADCYWHLELDEESANLTTFNTPDGRYRFNRMPFGISSAADEAQEMVEKHFSDLDNDENKAILAIFDDLIIATDELTDHKAAVRTVFQRARDRNIKFNLQKIQFCVSEVKYLGHIISSKGVTVDPEKVNAIINMPKPQKRADVQRYLGMVNYLAKFIPNLSKISLPLRSLLKKVTQWNWNHEHDASMEQIKTALTSSPVLAFFDVSLPVTLQVDASSHGLGACLMQNSHPITYASRSLTTTEQGYAQIEKELLAIVYGCERFNQYVYGRKNPCSK